MSADDARLSGEYEPQPVEGGTVQRIHYVGDSDPWISTCSAGDWQSGKGSHKRVTDALRDHSRAKHPVIRPATTGGTNE